MRDEDGFLQAIQANPRDDVARLVYADWLEDRGDVRGEFLRLHLALRSLAPDHVHRASGEHELSRLRKGIDRGWLVIVESERAHLNEVPPRQPDCTFVEASYKNRKWSGVEFHVEPQDTECDAWKRLLEVIEQAAVDKQEWFNPGRNMDPKDWCQIVTLPPTIANLKSVRSLDLYGSHLVRLPPEIDEMTSLEHFDPYTSYRLHWFPFEITRCRNLRRSRVSTRALYGNYKYRPPFPRLQPNQASSSDPAVSECLSRRGWKMETIRNCSICDSPFEDRGIHRVWISLRVATDVLPLLVNACSQECIWRLPSPPDGYVKEPHRGGLNVQQPPRR